MSRKPTRRGIRRRAARNRRGGTVYQNDAAVGRSFATIQPDQLGDALVGTPEPARQRGVADQTALSHAEVVQALVDLLDRSGWQRLEACRSLAGAQVNGYCVDADGQHLHVAELL